MNPTSRSLALRDPRTASRFGLMGAAALAGSTFAGPSSAGSGKQFGGPGGYKFGYAFGADASAAPMMAPAQAAALADPNHPASPFHPNNRAATLALVGGAMQAQQVQAQRDALIDPNAGATTKVERYGFSINQALVLGTVLAFSITQNPSVTFRAQRVVFNAPAPGFTLISALQVGNTNTFVGQSADAFSYSAQAQGVHLDLPTLSPQNSMRVTGNYTGFIPASYSLAQAYTFCVDCSGPATMTS